METWLPIHAISSFLISSHLSRLINNNFLHVRVISTYLSWYAAPLRPSRGKEMKPVRQILASPLSSPPIRANSNRRFTWHLWRFPAKAESTSISWIPGASLWSDRRHRLKLKGFRSSLAPEQKSTSQSLSFVPSQTPKDLVVFIAWQTQTLTRNIR